MNVCHRMKSLVLARCLLIFALLSGISQFAHAQTSGGVVTARLVLASTAVHAGEPAKLAAVARIAPGFHINDHHPSEEYLIPTELKLNPSDKLSVEKLIYPKGELKSFPFSDTPLSVYQGTIEVGALLKLAPSMPAGEFALTGKLSYQACNDHECLPPTSAPVSLTLRVVKRGVPLKPANQEIFSHLKFD
jgi:thiol:disulfide interchange protein DsbD